MFEIIRIDRLDDTGAQVAHDLPTLEIAEDLRDMLFQSSPGLATGCDTVPRDAAGG